jgi:glucosamine--fructose-6-phosphate aminotransferase (isomerizing)
MSKLPSKMATEIREAPDAVARQAASLRQPLSELAARLKATPPRVVVTVARGSSAHAATFAKHLIERRFGIPVAAAAPNIATVYRRDLEFEGQLLLAISQSGGSDDLIEQARSGKRSGALVVTLTNTPESALARASDIVLPMDAGAEESVAATKTFVASLSALLRLVALWNNELALEQALARLPERLKRATELEWGTALKPLAQASSLVAIGRGPTLAIAREAALKLKETSDLHAEAFSGAEFLHGPVALVSGRYPILMFTPADESASGLRALAADLRAKGAALFAVDPGAPDDRSLPALTPDHPEADAVCMIQSFYAMAVRLAELRGKDVDHPRHLKKVTRTR